MATALFACNNISQEKIEVRTCAPMPCGGRASACAATIDGKVFVFGGRDTTGHFLNDLWAYDAATDTWTHVSSSPLTPRVNATMAAANGLLYVGLGYSTTKAYRDTAYMRDWWSYSPTTDTWTRLADFPNSNTVAASSFAVDGNIYTIYGFGYSFTRDVCRYDVSEDSWTTEPHNSSRAKICFGGRGALCNGLLYFGLGFDTRNLTQWYEADLQTDTWRIRRSLPGKGREFAACAANKDYVYIIGGRYFGGDMTGGEVFDTYLRYSPETNRWTMCGQMPCGRAENQIAFSLNGRVYFGLGENEEGQIINQLYYIEN
ncbi:MAG: hypothetical protein K6A36_07395 [Paludibacteraceae bacterium]|nr:hypothetical protein [Paludibacteraceae bacterium]